MKYEKKSVGEIDKLIADFDKKHAVLQERQDADFDLWRLDPYKLDDYSDNVTSTYPRFYAQAVLSQLSGAKLLITVHRIDRNKELESQMEHGFYGWLRVIDEKLVERLLPPLQASASFMAAIRGFIDGRTIFYKDQTPEIFPYDPRYLKYGIDSKGIIWSAYVTYREPYAIEFEYNYKPKAKKEKEPSNAVKVIEWCDERYYMVIVDDQIVNESDHDWRRPPVVVVPVGAVPMIVGSGDKYDYIADWGDSIFGTSRSLYPVQSKILTIWTSLAAKSHQPSYFLFTPDGSMKLKGTPWGKGEVLPLPLEAKVEQVKPPDIASSVPQLYNIVSSLIGQGDYPSLYYGQLWKGQELSGKFAQNVFENVEQIKGTLLQAMSTFYRTALKKLADQYKELGQAMMVSGYDRTASRFIDSVNPMIYEGDYELEIDFRSISPDQEAANYAKAQVAKQSGLADDDFIRERIIQYQDPEKIRRGLYVDTIEKINPKIYMMRAIEALRKEGKEEEARLLEGEFQKALLTEMNQVQGQPQGQPQGGNIPPQGGGQPQPPQGGIGGV